MPTVPRRSPTGPPATARPDPGQLRQLRLARDLMDREWSRPLDLTAVAARAGYSRYHFVRRFRAAYGETPGHYLSRRRIERAQELLRSANLTVTEICFLVGFTSLGTFCRRFKQQTGTTPTGFRRQARTGGPAPIPGCFVLFWAGGFGTVAPSPAPARSPEPARHRPGADPGAGLSNSG